MNSRNFNSARYKFIDYGTRHPGGHWKWNYASRNSQSPCFSLFASLLLGHASLPILRCGGCCTWGLRLRAARPPLRFSAIRFPSVIGLLPAGRLIEQPSGPRPPFLMHARREKIT